MGVRTARIPENLDEYLKLIIREGYANTYGNAINLIILERMMHDKEQGLLSPFKYHLIDMRLTTRELSEIETENIGGPASLPLREAPPIAGPLPAGADITNIDVGDRDEYGFTVFRKPVYPGTMEQYEKDPKKDGFRPPKE